MVCVLKGRRMAHRAPGVQRGAGGSGGGDGPGRGAGTHSGPRGGVTADPKAVGEGRLAPGPSHG